MDEKIDIQPEKSFLERIVEKIPGFSGYIKKEDRRDSDKILREIIADRADILWGQISKIQRALISKGKIDFLDDFESISLRVRTFSDRIRHATYGYSGFFDIVKVKEEDLERLYEYDHGLLDLLESLEKAITNVNIDSESENLHQQISELDIWADKCLDAVDKRKEVILKPESE